MAAGPASRQETQTRAAHGQFGSFPDAGSRQASTVSALPLPVPHGLPPDCDTSPTSRRRTGSTDNPDASSPGQTQHDVAEQRRYHRALWNSLLGRYQLASATAPAVSVCRSSPSTRPSETRRLTSARSLSWSTEPKKSFSRIKHPLIPLVQFLPYLAHRPVSGPPAPVSVVGIIEIRLEDRLQPIQQRLLAHAVIDRRDAKRPVASSPAGPRESGDGELAAERIPVPQLPWRRSRFASSDTSNAAKSSPSTPPAPRLRFTRSQAISRFFRLYTLSTNEWTFLSPVGLIQWLSLLGPSRSGLSLMELVRAMALNPWDPPKESARAAAVECSAVAGTMVFDRITYQRQGAIPVGTAVAGRPPDRSVRAVNAYGSSVRSDGTHEVP